MELIRSFRTLVAENAGRTWSRTAEWRENPSPPPSHRSSVADLSEEVSHVRTSTESNRFFPAFGLYFQTTGFTRRGHQSLLKHDLQLPVVKGPRQNMARTSKQPPIQRIRDAGNSRAATTDFFEPVYMFKIVLSFHRARVHAGRVYFTDEQRRENYEKISYIPRIERSISRANAFVSS